MLFADKLKLRIQKALTPGVDPATPPAPAPDPATPPASGDDKSEALAQEVTALLETGEIAPDVDAVKEWATTKGLQPEAAEDFATNLLNAYFSTDDTANPDPATPPAAPGADDGALAKSAMKTLAGIRFAIHKSQASTEILAKALDHILDRLDTQDASQTVMKSSIEKIAGTPADPKAPVTHKQSEVEVPRKETTEILLKGVLAKELTSVDVSTFEIRGRLTDNAQRYLASVKKT